MRGTRNSEAIRWRGVRAGFGVHVKKPFVETYRIARVAGFRVGETDTIRPGR